MFSTILDRSVAIYFAMHCNASSSPSSSYSGNFLQEQSAASRCGIRLTTSELLGPSSPLTPSPRGLFSGKWGTVQHRPCCFCPIFEDPNWRFSNIQHFQYHNCFNIIFQFKYPTSCSNNGTKNGCFSTIFQPTLTKLRATESTNTTPNALFLAREDGGNVVYGLNYDSATLGRRTSIKQPVKHLETNIWTYIWKAENIWECFLVISTIPINFGWGRATSSHWEITGSSSLPLEMKSSMMLIGLSVWKAFLMVIVSVWPLSCHLPYVNLELMRPVPSISASWVEYMRRIAVAHELRSLCYPGGWDWLWQKNIQQKTKQVSSEWSKLDISWTTVYHTIPYQIFVSTGMFVSLGTVPMLETRARRWWSAASPLLHHWEQQWCRHRVATDQTQKNMAGIRQRHVDHGLYLDASVVVPYGQRLADLRSMMVLLAGKRPSRTA